MSRLQAVGERAVQEVVHVEDARVVHARAQVARADPEVLRALANVTPLRLCGLSKKFPC